MSVARTTRCCSAVALALAFSDARPPAPLPFFPTRAVWSLPLNNPLAAAPAYDATRAFFSIAGDRLVAYDIKPGTLAWTVTAAPTMALATGDSLVFVSDAESVAALHASDGSPAWRFGLEQPLSVPPVWDNGWLILADARGVIVALSARDGRVIWRRTLEAAARGRPALAADRVYVPIANTHVVALHVESGDQVWDRRLGGEPNDILALDDRIYVGATDNYLYCIDAESGAVDWRSMRTGGDVIGVPAYDDDRIYFVSLDNVLRAVSRTSGVQHWMKQLSLRPNTGPIRAGATIIVSGQAASMPAFNAKDGTPVEPLASAPDLAAPPHAIVDVESGLPGVIIVTRDLSKGLTATVLLITRGIDPAPAPVAALPGSLTTLPAAPPAEPAPREQRPD